MVKTWSGDKNVTINVHPTSVNSTSIHPTSLVEDGAELGHGVEIGPFCRVSSGSKIGDGTKLISHVVIDGLTTIGSNNMIYPFAMIGGPPQDLSYNGEPTSVVIGDSNILRESVTVHRGTAKDRAVTTIGNHNYLMAYCHIAHDCILRDHVIMANQSGLAGHSEVCSHVVIGGMSAVLQKCRLGEYSFLGASTVIRRDLPPFMAAKEFSTVTGPNLVGLRRNKFSSDDIRVIGDLYKIYYLSTENIQESIQRIIAKYPDNVRVKAFIDFVQSSQVGVQR